MARILVAARLPTAGAEARQGVSIPSRADKRNTHFDIPKVIDHLKAAAKYSRELEPGVHKYMILVPQDQSDTKTVWAIEEYASDMSWKLSVAHAAQ